MAVSREFQLLSETFCLGVWLMRVERYKITLCGANDVYYLVYYGKKKRKALIVKFI